jgi:plastocyanin
MSTNAKYVTAVIVIVIILAGAYAYASRGSSPSPIASSTDMSGMEGMGDMDMSSSTDMGTPVNGEPVAAGETNQPQASRTVTVTYTDQGFSPSTVTINEGDSVTFVNKSANPMWVASDPHPLHNGYDGTTRDQHCAPGYAGPAPFDECGTSPSFTFTFTKTGTWGYHNHAEDEMAGTVIVK